MSLLANYMHSPVGFGEYGNAPTAGSVISNATLVDITSPAELKGGKITAGLSVKKDGDQFKAGVELPLVGFIGLHAFKGDEPVTVSLPVPGPAQPILGANVALQFIPPENKPLDMKMIAGIGLGIVVVLLLLKKKK